MVSNKRRPGRPPAIAWQTTTEACRQLSVSRWVLANWRQSGELRKGYHWKVKNPQSARLTYLWHVERLETYQSSVQTEPT